jgi:hypothetical protein
MGAVDFVQKPLTADKIRDRNIWMHVVRKVSGANAPFPRLHCTPGATIFPSTFRKYVVMVGKQGGIAAPCLSKLSFPACYMRIGTAKWSHAPMGDTQRHARCKALGRNAGIGEADLYFPTISGSPKKVDPETRSYQIIPGICQFVSRV